MCHFFKKIYGSTCQIYLVQFLQIGVNGRVLFHIFTIVNKVNTRKERYQKTCLQLVFQLSFAESIFFFFEKQYKQNVGHSELTSGIVNQSRGTVTVKLFSCLHLSPFGCVDCFLQTQSCVCLSVCGLIYSQSDSGRMVYDIYE